MPDDNVMDLATGATISVAQALQEEPDAVKAKRAELKAKISRIYERGWAVDKMTVKLPPDMHGEWAHNSREEIMRYEMLGFEIDTKYAPQTIHSDGTSKPIVADAIFMVCSKENKEVIDEVKAELSKKNLGREDLQNEPYAEENAFATNNKRLGMPIINESKVRQAKKQQIEEALKNRYQNG